MDSGDFHGLPTFILRNEHLTLELLQNAGPRIVRLLPAGSEANLFAELPSLQFPSPHGPYTLYGGHRLWHAPELPSRTYVPDDAGANLRRTEQGARVHLPADAHSCIAKSIEVNLMDDHPGVDVRHTLRNEGAWPVELAAWAITQLAPGGVAILPQQTAPLDDDGVLPNRQLTLWPYTSWTDPRLELAGDFIFVYSFADRPDRFKIGIMNRRPWAAYLGQGTLFCKRTGPQPQQPHPDMGCNTEIYTDDHCLELETLSPLRRLEPGQELHHEERWTLHPAPGVAHTGDAIRDFIEQLQL